MSTRDNPNAIHYQRDTVAAGPQIACGHPDPAPRNWHPKTTTDRARVTCSACLRLADAFEVHEFAPRQGYGSSNANPRGEV